jgi:hypothetical protein
VTIETRQQKRRSTVLTFVLGIVGFALFGLFIWAVADFGKPRERLDDILGAERLEKLNALREEDSSELGSYAWVDKEKEIVRLPVERAMQLAAQELARKPVKASGVKALLPPPPPAGPETGVEEAEAESKPDETGSNEPDKRPASDENDDVPADEDVIRESAAKEVSS